MKDLSIYIHIPFCDHKCIYCDFYSIIRDDDRKEFVDKLKIEINYFSEFYSKSHKISTVFFGGGTPSLMEAFEIEEIINELRKSFSFTENPEITLETNPGTVNKEKLYSFLQTGVNRLSVGVQSFDDDDLKFLTRIHNSETAKATITGAVEAGFENISLDLIFNLPKQTKEKWLKNLSEAVKLPIKHISAYSLILERGTILNKMVLDGKVKISGSDFDAELYETTIQFLSDNNFLQYEVSNFCMPGFECRHNLSYWRYRDYIGFGPSAHSFVGDRRWWNYSALNYYLRNIDKENNAIRGGENLSKLEKLEEYILLTLRSNGLDLKELNNMFGSEWIDSNSEFISELIKDGYLIRKNNFLKFTAKGYSLCDEILLKFNYHIQE